MNSIKWQKSHHQYDFSVRCHRALLHSIHEHASKKQWWMCTTSSYIRQMEAQEELQNQPNQNICTIIIDHCFLSFFTKNTSYAWMWHAHHMIAWLHYDDYYLYYMHKFSKNMKQHLIAIRLWLDVEIKKQDVLQNKKAWSVPASYHSMSSRILHIWCLASAGSLFRKMKQHFIIKNVAGWDQEEEEEEEEVKNKKGICFSFFLLIQRIESYIWFLLAVCYQKTFHMAVVLEHVYGLVSKPSQKMMSQSHR